MATLVLGASAVTLIAVGFGMLDTKPLWPWFMISLVAMFAFRLAFYRSLDRDQNALTDHDQSVE
jgi:hypothetical protein